MRVSTFFLSILLAAQLVCLPIEAQAFPVSFNPDVNGTSGKLMAKIPLEKLGSVTIPSGRLKIKGNWAEVSTVQEFQFDHDVILSGPVLNTKQRFDNGKLEITGLAYFSEGDWLSYLSPAIFQETVSTDADEFIGRIVSIDGDAAEIRLESGQHKKIPLYKIRDIHSPRAFRFTLDGISPTGILQGQPYEIDANKLSILQTDRQMRIGALKTIVKRQGDDGDLTTGQLITIGTVISGIEIGQMIPFIVVPALASRASAAALHKEYETVASPIGISPAISVPSYLVPPPKF